MNKSDALSFGARGLLSTMHVERARLPMSASELAALSPVGGDTVHRVKAYILELEAIGLVTWIRSKDLRGNEVGVKYYTLTNGTVQ